jgi:hypothetical protein
MSTYPAPETLSHDQFLPILDKLKLLLDHLPTALPEKTEIDSMYGTFLQYSPDPEWMEMTGCEVSALSEQLKRVFRWNARTVGDGIVPIAECGAPICALHSVFSRFINKYPENNVLKKWIIDIAKGAEKVYATYDVPVRKCQKLD